MDRRELRLFIQRLADMRRGTLKRTHGPKRHHGLKSRPKPPLSPEVAAMAHQWGRAARLRPCAACGWGNPRGQLQGVVEGAHVIALTTLQAYGVEERYWYDLRNMLPLCSEPAPNRCHERHDSWMDRVPREKVLVHAPRALEFAREVNLEWKFDLDFPA